MRCDAIAISAPADDTKQADAMAGKMRAGKWRLNAGSRMMMCIDGVNVDESGMPCPVEIILDLDSLDIPERAPALADHDDTRVIGVWSDLQVVDGSLTGDLTLVAPVDDREAAALQDAVRAAALIRAGVPWQASVGVSADYEEVTDQPTMVNGQPITFTASDDSLPLYIARNGQLFEASVVLRGADSQTGQIAAKAAARAAAKIKEPIMSDVKPSLKELLAKHSGHKALVAELFADDKSANEIDKAVHDAELAHAKDESASLKKELEELKASRIAPADHASSKKAPGFQASTSTAGSTQSWAEARVEVARENPKLKGMSLNAEVSRRFPTLRATDCEYAHPQGSRN